MTRISSGFVQKTFFVGKKTRQVEIRLTRARSQRKHDHSEVEGQEAGRIVDIEVLITREEINRFYQHFDRKGVTCENSCYTLLVLNQLAHYEATLWHTAHQKKDRARRDDIGFELKKLRNLVAEFVVFESLVNNVELNEEVNTLNKLKGLLTQLKSNFREYCQHEQGLKNKLGKHIEAFEAVLDNLLANPSADDIQEFFSLQPFHFRKRSLGQFICEGLLLLTDHYMSEISHVINEPVKQLFVMHPALKMLSDTKQMLDMKGRSLYGVRTNNTRSPVPSEMIATLNPQAVSHHEGVSTHYWFSLQPFLTRLDDLEKVEDMVSFLRHSPILRDVPGIHPGYKCLAFFAGVLEMPLVVVHLILSLGCAFLPVRAWRAGLTQTLSHLHHTCSPTRHLRELAHRNYVCRTDSTSDFVTTMQKSQSTSKFNDLIQQYFTAEILFSAMHAFVRQLFQSVKNIVLDGVYLFARFTRTKADPTVKNELLQRLHERELALSRDLWHGFQEEEPKQASQFPQWPEFRFWDKNEYSSFLDFFDEILVGLSDVIVDPMFRKSPGLATLFFMCSLASLTVALLPSTSVAALGNFGKVLAAIPDVFSKGFTGEGLAHGSLLDTVIAVFLEWKTGFFLSKALVDLSRGDFEFIDSLFGDVEKNTLGLMAFMGMGFSLQFIPMLPSTIHLGTHELINPLTVAINFFTMEAKSCVHGQIPLIGIEYAFLGLKSMLLLYSLVSGTHHVPVDSLAREQLLEVATVSEHPENFLPSWQAYCAAHSALSEALRTVRGMEFFKIEFSSSRDAKWYYDHLDGLFEAYNQAVVEVGHSENKVNQAALLDVFYNKYCYTGSSNGVKLLSIALYPLTCVWRAVKYLLATYTQTFNSAAIRHQVIKSFCKDISIFIQLIAILGRFFQALSRALRNITQIKVHKLDLLRPLHGVYARTTRLAGTISDVQTPLDKLQRFLAKPLKAPSDEQQKKASVNQSGIFQSTQDSIRGVNQKTFCF